MNKTMLKNVSVTSLALLAAFAAADSVQVTVNGVPVNFQAAQPQTMNGRVLVPLRGVFEQMGAGVDWDPATQTVTANGGGKHIQLQIGSLDATVNDRVVSMDVAPQIVTGSTMVPLRFLSESLGASVDWQPRNSLVAIVTTDHATGAAQRFDPPVRPVTPPPTVVYPPEQTIVVREPRRDRDRGRDYDRRENDYVITRDTVIPLRLDQKLTSNNNQNGDHFTATVRGDSGRYLDLPEGTIIEGFVRDASPATGSHGGVLDLRFTHIRFPNGNRYPIGGAVTRLDDRNIVRTSNGRYVAKGAAANYVGQDAAIGAGAGLVIGSLKGKAVGGAVVGGAIGALVGTLDRRMARNVIFDSGTKFGLILNRDLTIERRDLRDR